MPIAKIIICPSMHILQYMKQLFTIILAGIFAPLAHNNLIPLPVNIAAAVKNQQGPTAGEPGKNYWQNGADYDLA